MPCPVLRDVDVGKPLTHIRQNGFRKWERSSVYSVHKITQQFRWLCTMQVTVPAAPCILLGSNGLTEAVWKWMT
jgi:hypothetical protein